MHQQIHQSAAHTRLNHGLNFFIRTVRQIRYRPARIDENFVIHGVYKLGESWESWGDVLPSWLWVLTTTKVAQRPRRIPQHAHLVVFTKQLQESLHTAMLQDKVTALGRVTGNVTQGPHGLLTYIQHWRKKEVNENRHGAAVDDHLRVLRGTRSNVGKSPSSFKLDHAVRTAQEFDKARYHAASNNAIDRGILLLRKELPELGSGLELLVQVVTLYTLYHSRQFRSDLHIQIVHHFFFLFRVRSIGDLVHV